MTVPDIIIPRELFARPDHAFLGGIGRLAGLVLVVALRVGLFLATFLLHFCPLTFLCPAHTHTEGNYHSSR